MQNRIMHVRVVHLSHSTRMHAPHTNEYLPCAYNTMGRMFSIKQRRKETSSVRAVLELLAYSRIWHFAIILDIAKTVDTPSTIQLD
jgi:hypothetical protein